MNSNIRKKSGFTLIELIVTISIVSILASIAIPSFTGMIKSNRISAGTNELVSALFLARSEALKRSNPVSICTSIDQATCSGGTDFAKGWVIFLDCDDDGVMDLGANSVACDSDGVTDDREEIIRVHDELSGLNIKAGAKQFMTYTFAGRSEAFSFEVKAKGEAAVKKTIILNRTGRVRTQ